MNNNIIDALVYAQIKNNIPENHKRYKKLLDSANIKDSGSSAQKDKLSKLLNMTTIKRAYCMGINSKTEVDEGIYDPDKDAYKITVKMPFNENYPANDYEKKMGYRTKEIYVPKKIASKKSDGGVIENDFTCNTFYGAYCENMKYFFDLESGDTSISNPTLFDMYAECACYGDSPFEVEGIQANIGNVGGGFPPKCYIAGCGNSSLKTAFLDPVSKSSECQQTICQSVTQVGNITGSESGVASFNNKINQVCGRDTQNNKQSETQTPKEDEKEDEKEDKDTTTVTKTDNKTKKDTEDTIKKEEPKSEPKSESKSESKSETVTDESKKTSNILLYIFIAIVVILIFLSSVALAVSRKNK